MAGLGPEADALPVAGFGAKKLGVDAGLRSLKELEEWHNPAQGRPNQVWVHWRRSDQDNLILARLDRLLQNTFPGTIYVFRGPSREPVSKLQISSTSATSVSADTLIRTLLTSNR